MQKKISFDQKRPMIRKKNIENYDKPLSLS